MNEHRLIHAACVLAPGAVLGLMFALPGAPRDAKAGNKAGVLPPLPVVPQIADGPAPRIEIADDVRSPFQREIPGGGADSGPESAPALTPQTDTREAPDFELTAVLPSESGGYAVINGAPWAVGEHPAPGWTFVEILRRERGIVLRDARGRRVVVRLDDRTE